MKASADIGPKPLVAEAVNAYDPASWTMAALEEYVGGLSNPSKMPGYAYSLPAAECIVGSQLRASHTAEKPNVCGGCYAMKGRYVFPEVQAAMYRRLGCITKPLWAEALALLLEQKRQRAKKRPADVFRWHDSGDLQSLEHLAAIARVAELTPLVRFWLPSREYRIVAEYVAAAGGFPANLNVRLSAHMVGGAIPTFPRLPVTVSSVSRGPAPAGAHRCPAPKQGNACGSCRACWDPEVRLVDYAYH